jgi:hypothetical protein
MIFSSILWRKKISYFENKKRENVWGEDYSRGLWISWRVDEENKGKLFDLNIFVFEYKKKYFDVFHNFASVVIL